LTKQNTQAETNEQGIDLRLYLEMLKKRRAMIVMITLLAVLVSGSYSFFVLKPVYEAKTVLMVTQVTDRMQTTTQSSTQNNVINSVSRIPVMTMNTYVGQLESEDLMKRVIERMNLAEQGYTPQMLSSQVDISATEISYLINVTVSNRDPGMAIDIANTMSKEFNESITDRNKEVMDKSVVFLQEQLAEVNKELSKATTQAERDRLQRIITQLSEGMTQTQIARSFDLGSNNVVVVSPAMSAVKVRPNEAMNIAVFFLLGLVASAALAIVLEFMDNTIKTPEDIARHLDLPVVGVIPVAVSRNRSYNEKT
jgi:capsular polysaccharide biosynthesis protein